MVGERLAVYVCVSVWPVLGDDILVWDISSLLIVLFAHLLHLYTI